MKSSKAPLIHGRFHKIPAVRFDDRRLTSFGGAVVFMALAGGDRQALEMTRLLLETVPDRWQLIEEAQRKWNRLQFKKQGMDPGDRKRL